LRISTDGIGPRFGRKGLVQAAGLLVDKVSVGEELGIEGQVRRCAALPQGVETIGDCAWPRQGRCDVGSKDAPKTTVAIRRLDADVGIVQLESERALDPIRIQEHGGLCKRDALCARGHRRVVRHGNVIGLIFSARSDNGIPDNFRICVGSFPRVLQHAEAVHEEVPRVAVGVCEGRQRAHVGSLRCNLRKLCPKWLPRLFDGGQDHNDANHNEHRNGNAPRRRRLGAWHLFS